MTDIWAACLRNGGRALRCLAFEKTTLGVAAVMRCAGATSALVCRRWPPRGCGRRLPRDIGGLPHRAFRVWRSISATPLCASARICYPPSFMPRGHLFGALPEHGPRLCDSVRCSRYLRQCGYRTLLPSGYGEWLLPGLRDGTIASLGVLWRATTLKRRGAPTTAPAARAAARQQPAAERGAATFHNINERLSLVTRSLVT